MADPFNGNDSMFNAIQFLRRRGGGAVQAVALAAGALLAAPAMAGNVGISVGIQVPGVPVYVAPPPPPPRAVYYAPPPRVYMPPPPPPVMYLPPPPRPWGPPRHAHRHHPRPHR